MSERHDVWQIADAMQMDIRALAAKMVELRAQLAALNLPKPETLKCPHCGWPAKGPNTLAEHVHVSHDGPLPPAWRRADELAAGAAPNEPGADEEPVVAFGNVPAGQTYDGTGPKP
jgi:hypothetical protein